MKKVLTTVVLTTGIFLGYLKAETPIKLSLLPGIELPSDNVVKGLDLGIIANYSKEMWGSQGSWIYSGAEKVYGAQSSFIAKAKSVTGIQSGVINVAESMNGLQIGLINITQNMKGLQIGLVNYIKNSSLPFMVIVNGKF